MEYGLVACVLFSLVAVGARLQTNALAGRLADATRTIPLDPSTGFYAPDAALRRAAIEQARANRLSSTLHIAYGVVADPFSPDEEGAALAGSMPGDVVGARLSQREFLLLRFRPVEQITREALESAWQWQCERLQPETDADVTAVVTAMRAINQ